MNQYEDHRKRKTKNYLLEALISLMRQKNVHLITVKELCQEAQINRSTFYAHYEDLPDFINKVMSEMAAGLMPEAKDYRNNHILINKEAARSFYCRCFIHLRDNREFFQLMMGNNGLPEFTELLDSQSVEWFKDLIQTAKPEICDNVEQSVLLNYIIAAHTGVMKYYLESKTIYSPEYMTDQLLTLTFFGPSSLLKLDC